MRDKELFSEIVIADFGLSTKKNEIKNIYKKCGTPGYIAPEILEFNVYINLN